ncbi:MAG: hypothetical protein DRI84_07940 [Bacteroidetes bacterium]|nr:MAG: hypothetical protein DRI84_07940 [Bacteroidota bacterium]
MIDFHSFPNRTACSVLESMRDLDKTKNYSSLLSMVEELQLFFDRMEAALGDKRDIKEWNIKRHKLKIEIKELLEKKRVLNEELGISDSNSD